MAPFAARVLLSGCLFLLRTQAEGLVGEEHFPLVYVLYTEGPVGRLPVARAVVKTTDPCPGLSATSRETVFQPSAVRVRAVGSEEMPYRFPVKVCEVELPLELPANSLLFGDKVLPPLSASPKRTVLFGDTGLRVKAENDGTCLAPGPRELYGIKQCAVNETVPFNPSLVKGRFQSLEHWPLKVQVDLAAKKRPDLVVHVGDYFYRQGPCPQDQNCTGINNQSFPKSPGFLGRIHRRPDLPYSLKAQNTAQDFALCF